MFKLSRKKLFIRSFIIFVFAATAVSISALLTANNNNQNTSARTGDNSAITVNGGETVHYGNSAHTDKYSITNANGETIRVYCAEASKDWPGGSNTAKFAPDSATSNIVKFAIFLNSNNSTAANTARNTVFGGWSGNADSEYAWTHAIISAAYASDYGLSGALSDSDIDWVDSAVSALRSLINNNDDAWIMAKNYQLYFAYGASGIQDVAWIEDNAKYGSINVQKCDTDTNSCTAQGSASLQGITFKIYNNSGTRIYNPSNNTFYNNGALIDTKTTNASGAASFTNLLANGIQYKVVETATNSSYQLTAGEQTTTLNTDGQTVSLKFYNKVNTGKIIVNKVDSNTHTCTTQGNTNFNGTTFRLKNNSSNAIYYNGHSYANGAVVDTKQLSGGSCSVTFDNLPYGSYIVEETSVSSGYTIATASQTVTIPKNNSTTVTIEFANNPVHGKITVNKKDSSTNSCTTQGNATFNGTTFRIKNNSTNPVYYNNQLYAKGAVIDTKQLSGGACSVTFSNLPYGSYIIEETAVGTGYSIATSSKTVTIPTSGSANVSVDFVNNPVLGKITVNKKDSKTHSCPAQGNATFNGTTFRIKNNSTNPIYYNNQSYAKGAVIDTKQLSGGACSVTFSNLPYGSYIIEETAVGTGYNSGSVSTKTVTIPTSGSTNVTTDIENDAILGKITVNKKDSKTHSCTPQGNATFNGTTFRIKNNSTNPVYYNNQSYANGAVIDTKQLAGGACSVVFDGLPYGTYIIEETTVGNGYTITTASKTVTIPTSGSTNVSVEFENDPILGKITVNKKDSATHSCTPQGNATFNGTTFRVINNSTNPIYYNNQSIAKGAVIDTKQLANDSCTLTFENLPYGTYIIEETAVGNGYVKGSITSKTVNIPTSGSTNVATEFENDPILGDLTVKIIDEDTGSCINTRGLTFNNAKFTVKNQSKNPILYNGNLIAKGGTIDVKTYVNDNCSITIENLPIGDYDVQQTEVTEGYSIDPNTYKPSITLDNLHPVVTLIDKPFRGDVKFVKMDPTNNKPMRDVLFSISAIDENYNIIETHIAVTNNEGVLDTSSAFALHTNNTNGYDALYDEIDPISFSEYGVWFGTDELGNRIRTADNEGALPYGKYIIQELRCGSNLFCTGVINQKATITINAQDQVIDLHDWNNTCTKFSLETTAVDAKDDDKYIEIGKKVTIKDKINYCVKPKVDFTIKGVLMDKATGEQLLINGQPVEESIDINSETDCGETEMNFTFDASGLGGKEIVVFETLYYKDDIMTSHEDIDDEAQTVEMVYLYTYATNNLTGEKTLPMDSYAEVKDVVKYCLKPGVEYTLKGALINKEKAEVVEFENEPVAQSITFTPEEACGEFEMIYKLNTTGLQGTDLVVFDNLYKDDELIIEHTDLNNTDETVTVESPLPAPDTGLFTSNNNGTNESGNIVFIMGVAIFVGLGGYIGMRMVAKKGIFRKKVDF